MILCEVCGKELEIGEWPYCPHGSAFRRQPFKPWIDENITGEPVEITSLAQWNRLMKENNVEIRDKMSRGDLDARNDKCEMMRRELARG